MRISPTLLLWLRHHPRVISCALIVLLCCAQSPGLIVADTKLDLTGNPVGFLRHAWSLWSDIAPLGQPRNQAYGYLFPHGTFFALGSLLHLPGWIIQRCWWSLLLCVGFLGIIRLAETLRIGTAPSRYIAAAAYLASPRVITTLGTISSETAPMMLAPWVLLPVIQATTESSPSVRLLAARSAVAVALMGAVNAVATAAACIPAALWWIVHRNPASEKWVPHRRWWLFTSWWILFVGMACAWWLSALFLLGSVSPPFLDFIESSQVTTRWNSLIEVLRGMDGWTPFVDPTRMAGTGLVSYPILVLSTVVLAAVGMAGLCRRETPHRATLTLFLLVGVLGLCIGYSGPLGGPLAETVRTFLNGAGAPLRNVHKLDPLIRMPLSLGIASALANMPERGRLWTYVLARPERSATAPVAIAVLLALALSSSAAWTGHLAPGKPYPTIPEYWKSASSWLNQQLASQPAGSRVLVAPASPWADQVWGLTRDEPLQALADYPWAVRDAIPLTPPGAIRSLDTVQRLFAEGRPSPALADTLHQQGFSYLLLRNDLDPETSHSTRPIVAHQSIDASPGLRKVAEFGPLTGAGVIPGSVVDDDLRARYPAIEIYRVEPSNSTIPSGPYFTDLDSATVVAGGAETLLSTKEHASALDDPDPGPLVLLSDARQAGLDPHVVTVTDTPALRATDYGRVDDHVSALLTDTATSGKNATVFDYPTPGAQVVRGEWTGAQVSVSSSLSDANGLSLVSPGNSPRAIFDKDPSTSWLSAGLDHGVGQWLQLDFDQPVSNPVLTITVSHALGPAVNRLEVATERGTSTVRDVEVDQPILTSTPSGSTHWLRVTAAGTRDGTSGNQFGISELHVKDGTTGVEVPILFRVHVPDAGPGIFARQWELTQEFPGRASCVQGPDAMRCARSLELGPEEPSLFSRTVDISRHTEILPALFVRSRLSPASTELLARPDRIRTSGGSAHGDSRGSAYAISDGDPNTLWTASLDSLRPGSPSPRLTFQLPTFSEIAHVRITLAAGSLPARPTLIAIDLGGGRQVRELDSDSDTVTIDVQPHRTNRVILTVLAWKDTLNVNSLGYAELQPPGLAEVEFLDSQFTPIPGTSPHRDGSVPDDSTVTVDCAHGPLLSIDNKPVATSVTATVSQLRSGAVIRAVPCDFSPLSLPAGSHDVRVIPGNAFVVDSVVLRDIHLPTPHRSPSQSAQVMAWKVDAREVLIPFSSTSRILVIQESVNPGWIATLAGSRLTPITVNGWQQGWIVPPETSGVLQLHYPPNKWYRLSLTLGLLALLPLFVCSIGRAHKDRDLDQGAAVLLSASMSSLASSFSGAAALIGSWLISGWGGVVITGLLILVWSQHRWHPPLARYAPRVCGLSIVASGVALSLGPWRSPSYLGNSALLQFCAFFALATLTCSVLCNRSSRLATHRATGCSIQE